MFSAACATSRSQSVPDGAPSSGVVTTGPSVNPLFNRKTVPLYSDLLLHDIGTGDGIQQASAGGDEIRTPALWGLRLRRPLLHESGSVRRRRLPNRGSGVPGRLRSAVRQQ